MTEDLKKIIFSQKTSNIFNEHNWIISNDPKKMYNFSFVGDLASYYMNIFNCNDKVHFQFTLDLDISNIELDHLLILINVANQNADEGFFVFDFKVRKIKYNLISSDLLIIEERNLQDFLKIKLDLTKSLLHNFVSGVHNIVYGEQIEVGSLELLFLNNKGSA